MNTNCYNNTDRKRCPATQNNIEHHLPLYFVYTKRYFTFLNSTFSGVRIKSIQKYVMANKTNIKKSTHLSLTVKLWVGLKEYFPEILLSIKFQNFYKINTYF